MRGRTGQVLTEGYVRYEGQDRAGIDRGTGQGRYWKRDRTGQVLTEGQYRYWQRDRAGQGRY